jgi:nitrate/nitrite transport system ATP-binding protein
VSKMILELSDVGKTYATPSGPLVVLNGISLKVQEGELVSIMGHSGCGKSTLLDIVAGLNQATRGGVILNGSEVREPGPDRAIVFQNYSLLPWLSALQNVLLAIRHARHTVSGEPVFAGETRAEHDARAKHYLELVGLGHALERYPEELSGGMKQRVSIARALALEPKVLILDEPFGALDAITREDMQDELLDIWARTQTTGLMVTHEMEEAILLSDRIVMMTNGPAATIGEVLEVPFGRPRTREKVAESPEYYKLRKQILNFLYERFAHDDAA